MAAILLIGEDPDHIEPRDLPPNVTPEVIRRGLTSARDALTARGHDAQILWTTTVDLIARELADAARDRRWDVMVIGAGLRTLPPMAAHFEHLINAILQHAPTTRLAFNSRPDDTAEAAERQLR